MTLPATAGGQGQISILDAVVKYASIGWAVVPLHSWTGSRCTCGGDCGTSAAKHPRTAHGLTDATDDVDQILEWWARWPQANVGLATGYRFDVLDIDGAPGREALRAIRPPLVLTGPVVVTGRGWHVYTAVTGITNKAGFLEHCDFRGRGVYVVGPPSVYYSGAVYRWSATRPMLTPLAEAPAALVDLLQSPPANTVDLHPDTEPGGSRYGLKALHEELGIVATTPQGRRNDSLHRSSCRIGQVVAAGRLDARRAVADLLEVARLIGRTRPNQNARSPPASAGGWSTRGRRYEHRREGHTDRSEAAAGEAAG